MIQLIPGNVGDVFALRQTSQRDGRGIQLAWQQRAKRAVQMMRLSCPRLRIVSLHYRKDGLNRQGYRGLSPLCLGGCGSGTRTKPGLLEMARLLNVSILAILLAGGGLSAGSMPGASGTTAEIGPEVCQVAVLRNGFTVQYARREVTGSAMRLWLCADAGTGYVEIPSERIERFEPGQSAVPLGPGAPPGAQETTSGILPVRDPIQSLIASAALRHQIDPDFVASVVGAESGFVPTAVSPKGAQGLMQLMPQTAAGLGVENAFDAAANVEGGIRYLRQLLDQYGGDVAKALAAYNAGPRRVDQYGGVPPYPETRAYVARVIDDYNRKKLQQQSPSAMPPGDK